MNEILTRFDKIVLLLSLAITNVLGTQKKQITRLSKFGLKPVEIACILDTTQKNVNKTLSQARKGGGYDRREELSENNRFDEQILGGDDFQS